MRLLTAIVLAMSIGTANAGTIVCDAPRVLVGDEPDQNPVVRVEVSYKAEDHAWRIFHHRADGSIVPRAEQYAITDWSNENKLQWTGTLNRNRALWMIGEVKQRPNGQIMYFEWLYDRGKNNQLVMHHFTTCRKPEPERQYERPSSAAPQVNREAKTDQQPRQVFPPVVARSEPEPAPVRKPVQTVPVPRQVQNSVPIYPHRDGKAALLDVIIGGQPVRMLLDTGASITQVNHDLARRIVMNGQGTWGAIMSVTLADGRVNKVPSIVIHSVRIGRHEVKNVMAGVSDGDDMLLGFPVLNEIGPFTINTRIQQLIFDIAVN